MPFVRSWIRFCAMKHLYCRLFLKARDPLFSVSRFKCVGSFTAPEGLLPYLSRIDSFFSSLPDAASPSHDAFSVENNLLFLLPHLMCEHCGCTGSALPSVFMLCGGLKRSIPTQGIPRRELDTFLYGD